MPRLTLTDRRIKSLKPASAGARPILWDDLVPKFGVRSSGAHHSYGVWDRWGGSKHPTWRAIGDVRSITLTNARDRARTMLEQNSGGTDPKVVADEKRKVEEEKKLAAKRTTQAIFSAVVEVFLAEFVHGRKLRTAKAIEHRVRTELIPHWGDLSVHAITRDHVEDLIGAIVKRPAPRYAHNVLDSIRMFFGWCIDVVNRKEPYKLTASPVDRIKPAKLIGAKQIRTRVLEDDELRALWSAADKLGYPFGSVIQMLMLCGCRLDEAASAQWREFNGTWIIPAERFKSGQEHRLPITADMCALLDGLPRFKSGDFLFSATHGKTPVSGFGKTKQRIDALMPKGTPPFVIHDIRRTVRSRLSALRIEDHVAEMAIGHGRKGLARVYDQHKYAPEIKEALTQWQGVLRSIVSPTDNVVSLSRA
jgi:integrase